MFYERRIGSFEGVIGEAATMDADGGIRLSGKYEGESCYAFVTRFGSRFTVMIYEKKRGKLGRPGRRLMSEEVGGVDELKAILRKVAPRKVLAYAY